MGINILKIAALAILATVTGCQSEAENPKIDEVTKRPNILILLADDMGYGDIGAYGSEIQTPNVDKLANEGIQFTNFHVGAACSPTRTMLMTGVDNHRAGLGNMTEI